MQQLAPEFLKSNYGITPAVNFVLQPEQTVIAHPGAVVEMSPDVEMTIKFLSRIDREGKRSILGAWCRKWFVGQGVTAQFTNKAAVARDVVLHPPEGGVVAWIDAREHGSIVCSKGSFLAATNDLIFDFRKVAPLLMGNQDTWMEVLTIPDTDDGRDHHVFLKSPGAIMERRLEAGEERNVHYDSLLAASGDMDIGVAKINNAAARWFGGEGRYFTRLKGPGTYWIRTSSPAATHSGGSGVSLDLGSLGM